MKARREEFHVRLPSALLKKLDARTRRRQGELGTSKWSRNDEIVTILEAAMKEGRREG